MYFQYIDMLETTVYFQFGPFTKLYDNNHFDLKESDLYKTFF